MIIYLLLCIISILTGRGILRLVGVKTEPRVSLYLSPVITLTFWTIFLGWGILLGYSVKQLWIIGWLATILLALAGFRRADYRFSKGEWILLGAVVFIPVGLMFPYFWHGIRTFRGSWFWDGWGYIAYGQYIWEYARGIEGGLTPFYQYAATLNNSRFISSSLLAFFSPLTGVLGDTQAASGYFLANGVFVFSSSCMLFSVVKMKDQMKTLLLTCLGLSVFSGWLLNVLIANNYDNLLAVSFLPAIAGVIYCIDTNKTRWVVILGGLMGGELFCYPEMAPLVLSGTFVLILHRMLGESGKLKKLLPLLFGAILIAAVLVLPWINSLKDFFQNQLNAAVLNNVSRPGEGYFPQLKSIGCFPGAFWGFWGPFQSCTGVSGRLLIYKYSTNIVGLALSFLLFLGLLNIFKKKEWGIGIVIISLVCGMLVMIFRLRYDYGAYKFILLNWWGISFAVTSGAGLFLSWFHEKKYKPFIIGAFVLFFVITGVRIYFFGKSVEPKNILTYKQVEETKKIIKKGSVIVTLYDPTATQWFLYYLRDVAIRPLFYHHPYLGSNNLNAFANLQGVNGNISDMRYLLTDDKQLFSSSSSRLIWSGGPYHLFEIAGDGWAVIYNLINPNGLEQYHGEQFFWVGGDDTVIKLAAGRDGELVLTANFLPGPSLPTSNVRNILIKTHSGYKKIMRIDPSCRLSVLLPIQKGENQVRIIALDRPTIRVLPNGDTRPLLLGIYNLKIGLEKRYSGGGA